MRVLRFTGQFGHHRENIHHGTIAFCHFESGDNSKTITKVAKKLITCTKTKLILVPFAHLFEKSASKKEAQLLFENLTPECHNYQKNEIVIVPFGIEKEFFLYAPAEKSAIKFLRF